MPVTRSTPTLQTMNQKRKKPPACDSCKARRVLCHPTTDGSSCPRCLEKGTKCTTTPVARGRPPKPYLGAVPPATAGPQSAQQSSQSASEEPETLPDSASSPSSFPHEFPLGLPPELVRHLFECFAHLPQHNHPMFRGTVLCDALSSLSWNIHLLPPQLKVLAHCVVALSASISFDPAIIGPGPRPTTLADRSVFTRGADLRAYGVRRAPKYRALCSEALRLASEVGVLLEPSEDNAVSCFILQFLEHENETRSRPWAVAYLSHVRAISESWNETYMASYSVLWTGFLLMEAMEATHRRQPILVSHHDQLLISGVEPLSLQDLFVSIQSVLQEGEEAQQYLPLTKIRPYLFHVTRLARQLSETITGDFARRYPLDESSLTEFISSLTLLQSIRSLAFDEEESETCPGDAFFCPSPQKRGMQLNLRACVHIMTFSRATLVLALHRELVRCGVVAPVPLTGIASADQWAAERLALLRRQVGEMADLTVKDVACKLSSMPSLPHIAHIQRGALVSFAQFCLDEADAAGGVVPERAAVMERISDALKLVGYSWTLPSGMVERLDAYVEKHRTSLPAAFVEDSMFLDMFPAPIDNNWMSMFTAPLGGELFPDGRYL
ncbi:hypothetical protein B0H13DRAFT_1993216 [Mycena leptocephala]|nr:hypothetical protein B0H13DRAFT_1993216 [Mycena leptocephala]